MTKILSNKFINNRKSIVNGICMRVRKTRHEEGTLKVCLYRTRTRLGGVREGMV